MGYKDKQKELKAPDDFQKLADQTVPFLERHGKTLFAVILGAVGVILVVSISRSWSERGEEQVVQELSKALRVLERDVNATPTEPTPEGEEPPFKTEAERDEALIQKLTAFREAHKGKNAAATAALPLAQALLRQNRPNDAVPLIDEFLVAADPNDPLRAAAYEARGYALESQKKYDEAMTAFDQLARENKTDFLKGMGTYHRARMLQIKGDGQAAAKQFAELQTQAPDTAAARLAKDRLALLVAQGVTVPTSAPVLDGGQ